MEVEYGKKTKKQKWQEFLLVNTAIFTLIMLLGAFALGGNGTISAFVSDVEPIYKADTQEKVVSLMCNVYWGTEYIEPYLELFKKENIKITFFIGGTWAKSNPELVQKMAQAGHEIANHGYNHKMHSQLTAEKNRQEILYTDNILKEITGSHPSLFAPPSGDFDRQTLNIAAGLGYRTILWSIDTIDWRDKDAAIIQNRVIKNLHPGAFILLHPTAETLKALPNIIEAARAEGYTFATVGEQIG